jgi:hypothetical protein
MTTTAWFAISAIVFFAVVFAIVMLSGTRLTGKQIDDDPDVRKHVDPEQRDEDFPVNADF